MSCRKYVSGFEKLKKRRRDEEMVNSKKGALEKFLKKKDLVMNEEVHENKNGETVIEKSRDTMGNEENIGDCNEIEIEIEEEVNNHTNDEYINIYDPGRCFPNACIAYRILLTIHVTVASAERSFQS